jgi:hypothetical protein
MAALVIMATAAAVGVTADGIAAAMAGAMVVASDTPAMAVKVIPDPPASWCPRGNLLGESLS